MHDDDDLIAQLCTRAGMIMEDASAVAVTMVGQAGQERADTLIRLAHATHAMQALINAAIAVDQQISG